MEEKAKQLAALLKVLANESRLMILCSLMVSPMTVTEIGLKVPSITQSALSQHLSVLKANGILDYDKKGQFITYFIKDKRIGEILLVLKKHYC